MTDKVEQLHAFTTMDIPADRVLEGAIGKLTGAVVIGWDEQGELYIATSLGAEAETLWLLEKGRQYLMDLA